MTMTVFQRHFSQLAMLAVAVPIDCGVTKLSASLARTSGVALEGVPLPKAAHSMTCACFISMI